MIGTSGLRATGWAILQTALAAGAAWYLARDVLDHAAPFFAPIAASVCMWATNVVRAQLAIEMVIGVGLGIGLGSLVNMLLGTGPIAMAVVVLVSLSTALLVGRGFLQHRPMFVNQTVISAILVLSLPHSGIGTERLFDALVGGGIAAIFSILIFPRNPVNVLQDARVEVLTAVRDVLAQTHCHTGDSDWMLSVAAALHDRLARLTEARGTAEQLARICPLRWSLRAATRTADRQAAQLSLLSTSVVQLARTITGTAEPLNEPVQEAVGELAAAASALTRDETAAAAAHVTSARSHTVVAQSSNAPLLTAAIDTCIDELGRVISLAPQ
ncbi:FUSC family protein [Mycolicibacter heraklionensis]|uniref:FUSC family protein n=1 Tax=Mycolicibacter heraklionensis TaxID=512402 RepID=A0A9X7WIV0_9MYCO|nr:FUSC family protein [Mycolicibacter heraklionensis]QZA08065.1 FUSC family protein [Mycolicibacter heraklionensis]